MTQKMISKQPQKILKGDRVSIPREILRNHRLKSGDYVLVEETDKGIQIIPAAVVPRE